MSLRYFNKPELILPDMICAWPGPAKVAQTVAETLRHQLGATPFAEVDPKHFSHPRRVKTHPGILKNIKSQACCFYVSRAQERDIILFIGQAQPHEEEAFYADTRPAYRLANLVLDIAERFHCRRIFASGAAVTQTHHTMPPHVWAIANDPSLAEEMARLDNVVLMPLLTHGDSQRFINGFNDLLIDSASQRGMEAVCLMGEVPYYLQGFIQSYPAAARAVLEVLAHLLDITLDLTNVQKLARNARQDIETHLQSLLTDKEKTDFKHQLETLNQSPGDVLGPITDKEQKIMLQHIEDLFIADDGRRRRLV
jgi:proteasome assembly chaperone (PAC2) family protein